MAILKILIPGYAREVDDNCIASSSTVYIEDNGKKIIVDPGTNRKLLLQKLDENNLKVEDIDYVFLTHYHIDHSLLMGIFVNAKILDDSTIFDNDLEIENSDFIPETSIRIFSTPGHDPFHCSLLIDTNEGKYVVAGDVFWWMEEDENEDKNYEWLINKEDPYVKNESDLINSRKKILEIADFIIPGHGNMFKNIFK